VQSATLARRLPLTTGGIAFANVAIDGYAPAKDEDMRLNYETVGPQYFQTMRIRLVSGRDFDDRDDEHARGVAIINETMAQRYWPGANALGGRLRLNKGWLEIVGIARDVKNRTLNETPKPFLYLPFLQDYRSNMILVVRTAAEPEKMFHAVRAEAARLDPQMPMFDTKTFEEHIGISLFLQRMAATLLSIFGVLALSLAAVGLYGVMAYAVSQRTRELGIRISIGAKRGDVLKLILQARTAAVCHRDDRRSHHSAHCDSLFGSLVIRRECGRSCYFLNHCITPTSGGAGSMLLPRAPRDEGRPNDCAPDRIMSGPRWSNRVFRVMWIGACTSTIGTFVQQFAQSWLVYDLTKDPFYLGLDLFLGQLPIILFSLIGGVFADRKDRRKLLLISQYIQMACAFLLATLFFTHVVRIWHILALSFVVGLGQSFGGPAYSALLPALVGPEDLSNAIRPELDPVQSCAHYRPYHRGPGIHGFRCYLVLRLEWALLHRRRHLALHDPGEIRSTQIARTNSSQYERGHPVHTEP
jgi:Transmembrane secretion effector/MacB-like periplasmic core domain